VLEATIHRPRGSGGPRAYTLIHGPNRSTKIVYRVTETTPHQDDPDGRPPPRLSPSPLRAPALRR